MLISIDLLGDYHLYSQNNNKKVGHLNGLVFGTISGINKKCDPSIGLISIDLLRDYHIYSQNNNKKVGYLNGLVFRMINGINTKI